MPLVLGELRRAPFLAGGGSARSAPAGEHRLRGTSPDLARRPAEHDPAWRGINFPAALGGAGLRAGRSQRPRAGAVGVFEGAVEAAEVAESAAERDRCDGPVVETGIEKFTA